MYLMNLYMQDNFMQYFDFLSMRQLVKSIFGIDHIEENLVIHYLYNQFQKIAHPNFQKVVEKRKNISLFSYHEISKPLPKYPFYDVIENNFYGNAHVLNPYFLIDKTVRIEHGLYIGSVVPKRDLLSSTQTIITLSEYRKEMIQAVTSKKVICTGPYIHYAQPLLSSTELAVLKNQLGRVLLIFPSHSIDAVHSKFDVDLFINKIKDIKNNQFDTVLVCLYWKDILMNRSEAYEQAGFKVVTAGHIYDYYFLSRLKSIIQLSNVTLSNQIGTHLGYCIHLNKPHGIIDMDVSYVAGNRQAQAEFNVRDHVAQHSFQQDKNHLVELFAGFHDTISTQQKECVDYYWGSSLVTKCLNT